LGDLVRHPASQSKDAINLVDGHYSWARANNWHSDVTFKLAPIRATVLRAVTLPRLGGDTMFANTVTAYGKLPPTLRQLADSLWGVHSNLGDFAPYRPDSDSEENQRFAKLYQAKEYVTEHPLVRVIAETGERSIVLGGHFRYFLGVSRSDSRHLFELFQSYVAAPENTVRWQWRPGDVGIWENRTTQHYALDDYGDEPRVMHSVTIEGDVPVGTDGRSSIARRAPPPAN
jgi:alpha-ketoglutarate-dependent taurine dioxygenase